MPTTHPSRPATGKLAAALMTAILLASPLALAQNAMSRHAAKAEQREETVDQRIATLHAALKITPAEESDWQAVAQTMRENAADMQKLAADKASQPADQMTAIDDLQTYQAFAQAHVDNLKKLTASFQTLYSAMPDAQKKIADQVFQRAHRQDSSAG
jgi:chromosome segregation ATPase